VLFIGPVYASSIPESIPDTSMNGRVTDLLSMVKVKKGKVVLEHAMKAYMEMEVKSCSFLTLSLDVGEWSASRVAHFTHKVSWYPLNRRLDGHWSWSGYFGEEKNLLLSVGNL
jgi:hypothetical protein